MLYCGHADRDCTNEQNSLSAAPPLLGRVTPSGISDGGCGGFKDTMKLIIVDLHGDGSCLRIINDTPENWKLAKAWNKIEDRECDFCDYMEAKGAKLHCTRRLVLGPA